VRSYLRRGIEEGATLVTGGAEQPEGHPRGYFVRPTVFANVTSAMTIAQEEIFGPVLCIMPYKDAEDAIRIANDTIYGLAGGVWSSDPEHAKRLATAGATDCTDLQKMKALGLHRLDSGNEADIFDKFFSDHSIGFFIGPQ
jgi:acyl-CoA reductase-like NAD-dependent aldehyde dehydrogenase